MSGKGSRPRPVDPTVYGREWERIFAPRVDVMVDPYTVETQRVTLDEKATRQHS